MGVSSGSVDRDIVAKVNLWKESRCHSCKEKDCITPLSIGLTLLLPLVPSPKVHFLFLSIFLGSTVFQVCLNSCFQCRALLCPSCWPATPLKSWRSSWLCSHTLLWLVTFLLHMQIVLKLIMWILGFLYILLIVLDELCEIAELYNNFYFMKMAILYSIT